MIVVGAEQLHVEPGQLLLERLVSGSAQQEKAVHVLATIAAQATGAAERAGSRPVAGARRPDEKLSPRAPCRSPAARNWSDSRPRLPSPGRRSSAHETQASNGTVLPLWGGAMWVMGMASSGSLSETAPSGSGPGSDPQPGKLGSATD